MSEEMVPHWRVMQFLEAMRAVHQERACLTPQGAAYLGVPFRFPTMAEAATSQAA